jgi:M6 family metalloprotease-like protein
LTLGQVERIVKTWIRRALVVALLLQLAVPFTPSAAPEARAEPLRPLTTADLHAPLTSMSDVVQAQQASVSGLLTIKFGDPTPGSRRPATQVMSVTDGNGTKVSIAVDANTRLSDSLMALNGAYVTISGASATRVAEGSFTPEPVILAQEIRQQLGTRGVSTQVTGTTRWATLLCRFPDDDPATVLPYSVNTFFPPLILGPAPSAEDYWKENSLNAVNFAGSTFHDWKPLPQTRAQYLAIPGGPNAYLDQLAIDCVAAAGAGLDFSTYGGINVMLSSVLDPAANSAWGGISAVTLGGVFKPAGWPVTWLPEFGYRNQHVVAHEMGHAFRLLHSSGPYTQTYDSNWDVMSGGGMCRTPDANYGCIGVHTNAYHKDFLGWIPAERRFTYAGTAQTFTLSQTANPVTTPGVYWAAKIPIAGTTTQFYYVEARKLSAYDREVPFDSVVIHKIDTTRADRLAQVVDPDNNGNPNDEGAAWTVGETYTDTANNFKVSILSSTANSFQVTIAPAATAPGTGPGNVKVQTTWVSPGRLQVVVDALGTGAVPNNTLRELRFGVANNALVDVGNGTPFAGGQTIPLPATPTRAVFFVNRVAAGPFMVRLEVADGVGTWKTFVGGGAGVP